VDFWLSTPYSVSMGLHENCMATAGLSAGSSERASSAETAAVREPYTSPRVSHLGLVKELTETVGSRGKKDARTGKRRTGY
jgi:hypothetical protein